MIQHYNCHYFGNGVELTSVIHQQIGQVALFAFLHPGPLYFLMCC